MPRTAGLSFYRTYTAVAYITHIHTMHKAQTPLVRFVVDLLRIVCKTCRQQIEPVKFKPHCARMC